MESGSKICLVEVVGNARGSNSTAVYCDDETAKGAGLVLA